MALAVDIPGWKRLELEHLVLDLNGSLALDGALSPGVRQAVAALGRSLTCHLATADTFGTAAGLLGPLARLVRIRPGGEGEQKRDLVRSLGADRTAALGNGANDALMLKEAAIGVAILGPEGAAPAALLAADVVVAGPQDALALFLRPDRLRATLRR